MVELAENASAVRKGEVTEGREQAPGTERKKRGRWLRYLLHAAVFAGLVVAGMKYVNGDEFWRAVHRFNWGYAPLILALTVGYMLTKGWRFVNQLREVTEARPAVILTGYLAGQSCTLLPAGMTARAGMLEQAGIPLEASAASIALSSLSDQVVLIFCSLLSALWFAPARPPALAILTGLVILSLVLGIEASRTWLLGMVERLMGKIHLLNRWKGFLESVQAMTSAQTLLHAVGNAALAFSLMVGALFLALRGVDAQVPLPTLLLAFTLPAMLGRISAMPGGVGVTEAGMIGILDAAPGVTADQAAAATMIFRLGTVFFAALVGALVYFFRWRRVREVRH